MKHFLLLLKAIYKVWGYCSLTLLGFMLLCVIVGGIFLAAPLIITFVICVGMSMGILKIIHIYDPEYMKDLNKVEMPKSVQKLDDTLINFVKKLEK